MGKRRKPLKKSRKGKRKELEKKFISAEEHKRKVAYKAQQALKARERYWSDSKFRDDKKRKRREHYAKKKEEKLKKRQYQREWAHKYRASHLTFRVLNRIKLQDGCAVCGYNEYHGALEFHHINPKTKSFQLSGIRLAQHGWCKIIREMDKCVLLCSNCHKEVHNGRIELDGTFPR